VLHHHPLDRRWACKADQRAKGRAGSWPAIRVAIRPDGGCAASGCHFRHHQTERWIEAKRALGVVDSRFAPAAMATSSPFPWRSEPPPKASYQIRTPITMRRLTACTVRVSRSSRWFGQPSGRGQQTQFADWKVALGQAAPSKLRQRRRWHEDRHGQGTGRGVGREVRRAFQGQRGIRYGGGRISGLGGPRGGAWEGGVAVRVASGASRTMDSPGFVWPDAFRLMKGEWGWEA